MTPVRSIAELSALRTRPRRLLAVFPHPDDEAYGVAGVLARLGADPHAAAVLLCLTAGEASRIGSERGLAPVEVARLRERRLEDVAGIVDLAGLLVGGLPDGRLAGCDLDEVAAKIGSVLEALAPQVVVTHDARGVNGHPDHIATHWAVRHALLGRPPVRLAMVAYPPEVAAAAHPRLLFPTPVEEIDAVVSLTPEETRRKEACLRVHEALVTLDPDAGPDLLLRPPVERFDLLGERFAPPVDDLFAGLA